MFLTRHDARLIAHYRTAAPILAAEVERLRAELDDAHRREAEALRRADAASASLAAARGDVRDLRAALEEQRLTLAADAARSAP